MTNIRKHYIYGNLVDGAKGAHAGSCSQALVIRNDEKITIKVGTSVQAFSFSIKTVMMSETNNE